MMAMRDSLLRLRKFADSDSEEELENDSDVQQEEEVLSNSRANTSPIDQATVLKKLKTSLESNTTSASSSGNTNSFLDASKETSTPTNYLNSPVATSKKNQSAPSMSGINSVSRFSKGKTSKRTNSMHLKSKKSLTDYQDSSSSDFSVEKGKSDISNDPENICWDDDEYDTSNSSSNVSQNCKNTGSSSGAAVPTNLENMVLTLLKQNKELLNRVSSLESKGQKKDKNYIFVPNDVRHHVKVAYKERENSGEKLWYLEDNLGPFHNENLELTQFIRNFVCGLHPRLENRDNVVNRAIKTYYQSKLTARRKSLLNKDSKKSSSKYQRKFHKAERRCKTLFKHVDGLEKEDKENSKKVLVAEMMSSEDEMEETDGNLYFVIHKPAFRSDSYCKMLKRIDKAYAKNCSKRSKDLTMKRVVGSPIKKKSSEVVGLWLRFVH